MSKPIMNQLVFIPVGQIYPHPNNPRKNLGEIEELAESIKARGVMQNLTVVPHPGALMDEKLVDCYLAVIGHRRLAAAKLAGLEQVPCTVSDMDEKEQVATMLLENIQRSDLTVLEQAEGFQMMLDMGETVETISGKTGFSQSTVRRRTKLLELDKKKFAESVERGATLQDYAELEKIKNVKTRNKLLEDIGTSNFNMRFSNALKDQVRKENKPKIIKALSAFATHNKDEKQPRGEYIQYIDFSSDVSEIKKPKDADKKEYFFTTSMYSASLYRKMERGEKKKQETKEEKEFRLRKKALRDLSQQAFALRKQFVEDYAGGKKDMPVISEFMLWAMVNGAWFNSKVLFEALGATVDKDDVHSTAAMGKAAEILAKKPEKTILMLAWLRSGDSKDKDYYSWRGEYDTNYDLDGIYKYLTLLGYQMSDEEKALQDGTHELFVRPEPEVPENKKDAESEGEA